MAGKEGRAARAGTYRILESDFTGPSQEETLFARHAPSTSAKHGNTRNVAEPSPLLLFNGTSLIRARSSRPITNCHPDRSGPIRKANRSAKSKDPTANEK